MLSDELKRLLLQFPEVIGEYEQHLQKGYSPTDIVIRSIAVYDEEDLDTAEVILENEQGHRVLIIASQGYFRSVSVKELDPRKSGIHHNLLLSDVLVYHKTFNKSLFRGYNMNEVDEFLDVIMKDYTYIEHVLVKENELLKKEIQQLRGRQIWQRK
ncbi:DivIVA domain-containing protein [Fictibacillus iocasae]|uniref:DivIVA domain-containing protein n=1 Tax=Fictibacillus iocasae TaxID=2715437 RepID=A0ABW2NQJ4_9BACL